MFSKKDISRNECMLRGPLRRQGYDWWWHSLTARNARTGEEKPFFIEFFLCNPDLAEDSPTLGQLPRNKAAGKKPSYLMVNVGTWGKVHRQLHRFFAWKDIKVHFNAPYSVEAADCYACETELRGSVDISEDEAAAHPEYMCDAGSMSWHLTVSKQIPYNVGYGASRFFRLINAFEMYWHAEGIKTYYEGEIIFNGEKYIVTPETCNGYADKNWGSDFTTPWVWLSSWDLTSKISGRKLLNSVFEIGGGRPKVFGVALDRKLLGGFYYEGKCYEFNFSKFWTLSRTAFEAEETDDEILWYVRQETFKAIMETHIRCFKEDMLLINYEAPNGTKRHQRLWNGGNGTGRIKLYKKSLFRKPKLIDDVAARNIGCEYGEYDTTEPYTKSRKKRTGIRNKN